jgi:uncharacterized membrane protein
MIRIVLLVLTAEICVVVGQILFKKSTNTIVARSLGDVSALVRFLLDVLAKPSIWAGLFFLAGGLVIWLIALAQGDLSLVYPISSLQYILILCSAQAFLQERIDAMKLIGTSLVVVGIILAAIS